MKASFLTMYGLVFVGVIHSHDQFLNACHVKMIPASFIQTHERHYTGLKVHITPPVMFSSNGSLKETADSKGKLYKLILAIEDNPSRAQELIWETTHGSESAASSSIKVEALLKYKFGSGTYNIGWELEWNSLQKLVERKELYPFPETSIDPQIYITKNPGMYSFSWVKGKGPRLHFGDNQQSSRILTYNDFQKTGIEFLLFSYADQNVAFQLGMIESGIPPRIFQQIVQCGNLEHLKLELVHNRIRGRCSLIADSIENERDIFYHPLNFDFDFGHHGQRIQFKLAQFIIAEGDICTLLIGKSTGESNEWVLGSSFLRAYNVTIDTGEVKTYKLVATNEEDLL
ncbi:unnamed protein product [Albugo candida]|uniref:Peptidase A1 domain-containing protein n=1 Tax=Albugo candida TaxID=65357 RepID=A0A024GN78_9STRA|nr:unnamed protein product [Albugo candida]|eukprot:CCI48243.1 unnamed protein product [Albugo candida]